MKEEWLFRGALVPVDMETTAALVAEIKRLIDVVGGMALAQPEERNFCPRCGKRTPDLTTIHTCTPPKRPWVGLTDEEIKEIVGPYGDMPIKGYTRKLFYQIEAKLKEKNT